LQSDPPTEDILTNAATPSGDLVVTDEAKASFETILSKEKSNLLTIF
tara:strand:+ start:3056 stop:3196 length:141 start_codon:yes stop_codon:yes gene_type:complete